MDIASIAFFIFDTPIAVTMSGNSARENILSKIKSSLAANKIPKPFPEAEGKEVMETFGASGLSAEEAFADNFIKLGGKFIFCENEQHLIDNITELYDNRDWQQLLCAEEDLLRLFAQHNLNILQPADEKAAGADACITGCELLIGRTGSAIFSSMQHMGRTAPVFYPAHIIIAYAGQAVDDISDGINMLKERYSGQLPSMINLNTGPSRTADIEKTLVVGVHGPGEVFCFYVNRPYKK